MRYIISVFLILSWLIMTDSANAETTIIKLPVYKSAGQLWLDKDGNLQGFRLKVLEELNNVLKKDSIEFRYRITEWGNISIKRCIKEILDGNYDAYFGLIYSKKREKRGLIYSKVEIYSIPTVVWMNKKNMFKYSGLESLRGKKIGIVLGYPYLHDIKNSGFIVRRPDNDETNMKMLADGMIDVAIDNVIRTGTVIAKMRLSDKITYADKPFSVSDFYIAYNKNVPMQIINKADAALKKLHESGAIKKILDDNILILRQK
ncbi:hypothetical protein DENIS_5127 [Desulfonema ishimotonii]|uniref:Uncharacterized protein n=1 Tax=Desulfonema ishimotonii TaxID=45657 RepID=A0A401G4G5_9BACT|nr:transporter substrate-binding domain-containing protein [Desulfonema ishimotonii]GBC64110.1 hypothetical protein DENIS_5127 [Desulfonema ishimotonii]